MTGATFTRTNLNKFINLEKLDISKNEDIIDGEFVELAQSTLAKRLKELNLQETDLTTISFTVENLNQFSKLEDLKFNSAAGCNCEDDCDCAEGLRDKEFEIIAQTAVASNLNVLDLDCNDITDSGLSLRNFNRFTNLKELNLQANQIGDRGFCVLSQSIVAPNFTQLGLYGNKIKMLKGLNRFTKLKELEPTHYL